jgi:hypothetical protein
MGSRFLKDSATNLTALQDGAFDAVLASLAIPNKSLNQPAVFDSGVLTQRLLETTDLNFQIVDNPVTSSLVMSNNRITGLGAPIASTDAATKAYVDDGVTILSSAGGTTSLVKDGTGPNLEIIGVSAGSNIALAIDPSNNFLTISASPFTAPAVNSTLFPYVAAAPGGAIEIGQVKADTIDPSFTSEIVFSTTTDAGVNVAILLSYIADSNVLYIQDASNSTNYQSWGVFGNPVNVLGSSTVAVVLKNAQGLGLTGWPVGRSLVMAVITDTKQIDTRITTAQATGDAALPKVGGTLSGVLNSLNILPVTTNTNGVGSATFPYLTSEATTSNCRALTIWNAARSFNHTLTSLASVNQAYTLPATQVNGLCVNTAGALTWATNLGSLALTTTGTFTSTNQTINGTVTLGASATLAMGARPITSTGTMTMGLVTLSNTLNSLNILPTVTNTNGVGSSTFPYLTSEATTSNCRALTIWNAARTFNHSISSLASANQSYTLPATQPVLPGLLENNGSGALSWNTKTLGSLWVHGNTLNTAITPLSTYVSLNVTTWNTGSLVNFSRVNGVLTYNGTVTKTFLVSYSGYFVNNTAGTVPLFQILGGAGRGFCSQSCPTAGALYQFSSQNLFTIAPGASIEIQVQASSVAGGVVGNINVFSLFFNATQVD